MSEAFDMDGFEVVQERGTTWEPKYKKVEGGENKPLEATDKSWVAGYYMGCKEDVGQNNSTVHEIKILRQPDGKLLVGDKKHLASDPALTGDLVSIWGTKVLDDKIAENVVPGQAIKITWLGKQKPKSGQGKPYSIWELAVNTKITPLEIEGPKSNDSFDDFQDDAADLVPEKEPQAASEGEGFGEEEDDMWD